jgi:formate--tetrahydrofolate ligase
MAFKTDIEIAREAKKKPIMEIGQKLGIPSEHLLPYGHDKAKVRSGVHQVAGRASPMAS